MSVLLTYTNFIFSSHKNISKCLNYSNKNKQITFFEFNILPILESNTLIFLGAQIILSRF